MTTIFYCIENEIDNSDIGKHNYIRQPDFNIFTCEFCFLEKKKANYIPMMKVSTGKFRPIDTIPEINMTEQQLYAVNLYKETRELLEE
jgi:hypothetical protein